MSLETLEFTQLHRAGREASVRAAQAHRDCCGPALNNRPGETQRGTQELVLTKISHLESSTLRLTKLHSFGILYW